MSLSLDALRHKFYCKPTIPKLLITGKSNTKIHVTELKQLHVLFLEKDQEGKICILLLQLKIIT